MKLETVLWIFCIIVMVGLTAKLSIDSLQYSCDKCTVDLTSKFAGGGEGQVNKVNVVKLIEAYKEDATCLVIWDPVNGFIKNGY